MKSPKLLMKHMKKVRIALQVLAGILLAPIAAYAINITVPSAPGNGYFLTSTSTGAYIATTTDPAHFGSVFATSTTASSTLPKLESTVVNSLSVCINGDCRTVWPSSGGSGTVSTSSSEVANRVPFWTTTSGTPANLSGGSSAFVWNNTNSNLSFTYGSSTALSISGALYNGALTSGRIPYITTNGQFTDNSLLRFDGTNLGVGTATPGTLLSVGNTTGINFTIATSSFASTGGINLTNGCFAVNGTCLSGGGSAAGSDSQVQFNDGGSAFGGAAGLIWKKSTGYFGIGTTSPYSIVGISTTTQQSGNVLAITAPEIVTSQSVSGISTTTYTSNDTFIIPTGATSIDVYMVGGGGGSGGTDGSTQFAGGGGGSSAFGTYIIAGGGGGGGNRSDACGSNAAAGGGGGYASKTGITVASIGGVGASIPIVVGTRGVFNGTAGVGYFNGGSVTAFTGGGGGGGGATADGQSRSTNQKAGGAGGSFIGGGGGGICDNSGTGGASGTGAAGGAPGVGGQPGAGGGSASGGGGGGYATSTLSSVTFGYGGGGAAQNAGGAGAAGGGAVKGGDAGAANGGAGSGGGTGGDAGATGGAGGGFYSATYGKGSSLNSDNGTNGVVVVVVHGSPITQITGFKSIVASLSTLPAAGNGNSTTSTTTLSLGIGTTSPSALLSLESIGGQFSRMIGSMINGIHYVVEALDQFGHLVTGGKVPTCGSGCASVSGDDRTMIVVAGSSVTSIAVNFANTYTKSPVCIPSEENAGVVALGASTTPTVLTITTASALTTKTIAVICQISNNFTY